VTKPEEIVMHVV